MAEESGFKSRLDFMHREGERVLRTARSFANESLTSVSGAFGAFAGFLYGCRGLAGPLTSLTMAEFGSWVGVGMTGCIGICKLAADDAGPEVGEPLPLLLADVGGPPRRPDPGQPLLVAHLARALRHGAWLTASAAVAPAEPVGGRERLPRVMPAPGRRSRLAAFPAPSPRRPLQSVVR